MKMIFDEFQGKTAIVTGAASGMGLLCAQRLAENGANVILADANEEGAAKAAADIAQKGGSAVAAAVDVRFYDQVEAVARLAMERFGRIDILVNCAGGYSGRIAAMAGDGPGWSMSRSGRCRQPRRRNQSEKAEQSPSSSKAIFR